MKQIISLTFFKKVLLKRVSDTMLVPAAADPLRDFIMTMIL